MDMDERICIVTIQLKACNRSRVSLYTTHLTPPTNIASNRMELGGADYIRTTTTAHVFNPSSQHAGMKWFFFLQKWTNGASTVTWRLNPP